MIDLWFERSKVIYQYKPSSPEAEKINGSSAKVVPVLGRFLSPDNYVQDPWNSQSYNRYTYCWNNPLKYTDPSGDYILSLLFPAAAPFLLPVDLFLWGSTIEYFNQVSNNYSTRKYYDKNTGEWKTRSNNDIWWGDIDLVDVGLTGGEYAGSLIPGFGKFMPLLTSPLKNNFDYTPNEKFKNRKFSGKYFWYNTLIDYGTFGLQEYAKHSLNLKSKNSPKNIKDFLKKDFIDIGADLINGRKEALFQIRTNLNQLEEEEYLLEQEERNSKHKEEQFPDNNWDRHDPWEPPIKKPDNKFNYNYKNGINSSSNNNSISNLLQWDKTIN